MDIEEIKEWLRIADDDLYSAKILNEAVHKPYEIICYHCAQAVEKYLKFFLVYNDIIPKKTHDLVFLSNLCIEKNNEFQNINTLCGFLNRFTNTRYPHRHEITEDDVTFSINAVEKVRNCKPIIELIDLVKE